MSNGEAQTVLKQAEAQVKSHVSLGASWRDWDKPLGARKAPPIPVVGKVAALAGFGADMQNVVKGYALRAAAVDANLAAAVQREIEALAPTIAGLLEPQQTINLAYLRTLANCTIVAGKASQQMRKGLRPSKGETQLAAAWVVTMGCGLLPRLDARVKGAAIKAFPLFTAGKALNEFVDPAQAIHAAYVALDVA